MSMRIQNLIPALFLATFIVVLFLWFFTHTDFRIIFAAGFLSSAAFVTSICVVALPAGYIRRINLLLTLIILVLGILLLVYPASIGFSLTAIPAIVAVAIELCLWEVAVASGLYRGKSAAFPLLAGIVFFISLICSLAIGTSLALSSTALLITVVLALLGILFGYKKEFDLSKTARYEDQSTYDPKA